MSMVYIYIVSAVVQFNESSYIVYENESIVQPVLVLNASLPYSITVKLISRDIAATSKCIFILSHAMIDCCIYYRRC